MDGPLAEMVEGTDLSDEEDNFDADAPRIAQWVDEEELEQEENGVEDSPYGKGDADDTPVGPSALVRCCHVILDLACSYVALRELFRMVCQLLHCPCSSLTDCYRFVVTAARCSAEGT